VVDSSGITTKGDHYETLHFASSLAKRTTGHENPTTIQHYIEADLAIKERALARLHGPEDKIQRYSASDSLIDFLKTL